MKLRSIFLAFTSLLFILSLASADQASMPADPASVSMAAIFSIPASPDCADAKLPSFELTPTDRAGVVCGTCSDTICQGKQFGQFCDFKDNKFYYCQPVYIECTPRDCQCWTGPLP